MKCFFYIQWSMIPRCCVFTDEVKSKTISSGLHCMSCVDCELGGGAALTTQQHIARQIGSEQTQLHALLSERTGRVPDCCRRSGLYCVLSLRSSPSWYHRVETRTHKCVTLCSLSCSKSSIRLKLTNTKTRKRTKPEEEPESSDKPQRVENQQEKPKEGRKEIYRNFILNHK